MARSFQCLSIRIHASTHSTPGLQRYIYRPYGSVVRSAAELEDLVPSSINDQTQESEGLPLQSVCHASENLETQQSGFFWWPRCHKLATRFKDLKKLGPFHVFHKWIENHILRIHFIHLPKRMSSTRGQAKQSQRRFSFHTTTGTDPSSCIAAGVESSVFATFPKWRTERAEEKNHRGDHLARGETRVWRIFWFLYILKMCLQFFGAFSNPSNSPQPMRFQYYGIGGCQCKTSPFFGALKSRGLNGRSYKMQEDPMSLRSASRSDFKGLDVLPRPTCELLNSIYSLCSTDAAIQPLLEKKSRRLVF